MTSDGGAGRRVGRPRVHPPQKFHPTSVRLNPDDLAQVDAVCARTGWSRNEAIRIILRLGFKLTDTIPAKDRRAALEVSLSSPEERPPGRAAAA